MRSLTKIEPVDGSSNHNTAGVRLCITNDRHCRYLLCVHDPSLLRVLQHDVLTLSVNDSSTVEVTMQEFARYVNMMEKDRELSTKVATCAKDGCTNEEQEANHLPMSTDEASRKVVHSGGPPFQSTAVPSPTLQSIEAESFLMPTLKEALLNSIRDDASLFFALSKELYEISRDPLGGCKGDMWRLEDHCSGFRMCVELFRHVYDTQVRPVVQKILPHLHGILSDHLINFRNAVLASFRLPQEDPSISIRSKSNLDSKWVYENIKSDTYFFPPPPPAAQQQGLQCTDVTLSHLPLLCRQKPTDGKEENDTQTFGLTQLLENPTWEPDNTSTQCPVCLRTLRSISHPLGIRAHHCRCCGRRLCAQCIVRRAHRSFAKLIKPGTSGDAPSERLVCNCCHEQYMELERIRYLGALFALAGLDFVNVSLCRTVNKQWRNAAELCISEYRLLLHTCEPDLRSVLSPIGVLLQNSIDSIVSPETSAAAPLCKNASPIDSNPESAYSHAVLPPTSIHREAALLLLQFIRRENLWELSSSRTFISRLALVSSYVAARRPAFSHWHFYCTAFCRQMDFFYFCIKTLECLCHAPSSCNYVQDAKTMICKQVLQKLKQTRYTAAPRAQRCSSKKKHTHNHNNTRLPFSDEAQVPPANVEAAVLYLLDLLCQDAATPQPHKRIYQGVLEVLLPKIAMSSLQLAFVALFSLLSATNSSRKTYDFELLGLWQSRILEEICLHSGEECRAKVEATLHFFKSFDTYCSQLTTRIDSFNIIAWIRYYCIGGNSAYQGIVRKDGSGPSTKGNASNGVVATANPQPSFLSVSSVASSLAYVDLPCPLLNPFKPWMELRSIFLTSIRMETASSTKPLWITFSTYNSTQRCSRRHKDHKNDTSVAAKDTSEGEDEEFCSFLYKRENSERDQLMCISARLLQWLLRSNIGNHVQLGNYSVLPLSDHTALIEKADGYVLSKLPGVANGSFALLTYLVQRDKSAQRTFLVSAKLFLLLNYIFSIGDRHQDNVMMSPAGAILHIDFGYIFSERTFVEKIAGTTMRVDSQLLSAVEFCRRVDATSSLANDSNNTSGKGTAKRFLFPFSTSSCTATDRNYAATQASSNLSRTTNDGSGGVPALGDVPFPLDNAGFFRETAEWFLEVRPYAAVFYELWRYAVHRHSLSFDEHTLATIFNTLFDRSASRKSSADNFFMTIEQSINVCRLKDVTHSGAEAFRVYMDHMTRRVTGTPSGMLKILESMFKRWAS